MVHDRPEATNPWTESLGSDPPATKKGQATRAAILAAARELFGERGYQQTRVVDIVERAGLSTGAFYRYFTDKHEVLLLLLSYLNERLFHMSRARWQPSPHMSSVYETTVRYLGIYREFKDLIQVEIEVAQTDADVRSEWNRTRKAFFERIERAVRRAQDAGMVKPSIDPALASALLGAMTEHYAYLAFILDVVPSQTDEVVARHITDLWGVGVLTAKGRQEPRGGSSTATPVAITPPQDWSS